MSASSGSSHTRLSAAGALIESGRGVLLPPADEGERTESGYAVGVAKLVLDHSLSSRSVITGIKSSAQCLPGTGEAERRPERQVKPDASRSDAGRGALPDETRRGRERSVDRAEDVEAEEELRRRVVLLASAAALALVLACATWFVDPAVLETNGVGVLSDGVGEVTKVARVAGDTGTGMRGVTLGRMRALLGLAVELLGTDAFVGTPPAEVRELGLAVSARELEPVLPDDALGASTE